MEPRYLERFLSRLVITDGCWEWDGAHTTAGYGETWDGERVLYTHRVAYELWVGPIPPKFTIDHLCQNKGCCNVDHLEAVSQRTNILRSNGMSARHARVTHCPLGHPYDEANTHISPDGRRQCRTCWPIKNRERRTTCPQGHPLNGSTAVPDSLGRRRCKLCLPTHCPRGHPYDEANTYVSNRGDRMCRTCSRERAKKARQARKGRKERK